MRTSQPLAKGFSLIELLIVIAIIGILSSLAVPQYQDHLVKAKTLELFALAAPAKLAVVEALINGQPLEAIHNEGLGIEKINQVGYAEEISISNANITLIANAKKLGLSAEQPFQILLSPRPKSGTILWSCAVTPAEFIKYTPSECRKAQQE